MRRNMIARAEFAWLQAERPRVAGANARLSSHGREFKVPIVRLITRDGVYGIGIGRAAIREDLEAIVGLTADDLFVSGGVAKRWLGIEGAAWDLRSRLNDQSLHAVLASEAGRPVASRLRVPCYDTSLYMDDVQIPSDSVAADLIAGEAEQGAARGHRAFKVKVGRGARHMAIDKGLQRDLAVVRAVREAIGPSGVLLLDANNGYNLNLTKHVLAELADCRITWMEEPFSEDPVLYEDLKAWLAASNLDVLIADGEDVESPVSLIQWASRGLIDVIQFDILGHGITRWIATGRRLRGSAVRCAPHHFGLAIGNHLGCHLAAALPNFAFVEWDEAQIDGIDAPGYHIEDGSVVVPDAPGLGLMLDEGIYMKAVAMNGYSIQA